MLGHGRGPLPGRLLAMLAVTGALFGVPTAAAATGSLVADLTTPDGAGLAPFPLGGVNVAFAGQHLFYTNWDDGGLVQDIHPSEIGREIGRPPP